MKSVRADIGGLGNLLFKQAYIWAQMRDGAIPDIYLQSEKYFAKYRNEVHNLFGTNIGSQKLPYVALHIRRGDYLKASQFHTPLWQTDYYKEAVKLFPGAKFLVFCKDNQDVALDMADRAWCAGYMRDLGVDFTLHEHGSETEDLNAMANCEGLIGANSSFSWWAAWLGNHSKKVFPKESRWFVDGVTRTELPKEWLQLDFKYTYE